MGNSWYKQYSKTILCASHFASEWCGLVAEHPLVPQGRELLTDKVGDGGYGR